MPYIQQYQRDAIDGSILELADSILDITQQVEDADARHHLEVIPGVMNYAITALIHTIVAETGESYATYNAMIGMLESAKLELYRKMVSPYEDQKEFENGPVQIPNQTE